MRRFVFATLLVAASADAALAFDIVNDTYVDSYKLDAASDNTNVNYGGSGAMKAVSSYVKDGDGSFPGYSLVHGLFTLPQDFWTTLGSGPVTSPVYVQYTIKNNSLASTAPGQPTPRRLELLPLTQAFTSGDGRQAGSTPGSQTQGGTKNTPTYVGADWMTAMNGVVWSTPGGSIDTTAAPVVDDLTSQLAGVAKWDIKELLNNAATRAEIFQYGLLLRTSNETVYGGTPGFTSANEFASMISYEAGKFGAASSLGKGPTVTIVPEPTGLIAIGGVAVMSLLRRRTA